MKTLYVHIPFCEKKCFYCSFVISVGQARRIDGYLGCLDNEALTYGREKVASVYIGGGTPTVMNPAQLTRLLGMIRSRFDMSCVVETTIESNPEGLDLEKLKLLKKERVTRISLGVQSLNDRYLKILGRNHNALTAQRTFDRIRKAGFENINLDLMFGFPGQTLRELEDDVDALVRLNSEHVSIYALTVEENSRFFTRNIRLQEEDDQAQKYTAVTERLAQAGFAQYEISNYARPGRESYHNIHYWSGGEYIGLGV
ncbi:MAG TPA: radical SAM family heme chaperone HemW, partial [Candidatus Omnitrophota bacterium]|nr:radical SAM family heme chaperone HemW [Candidatus Omnitrophota bacterium]